jgi:hypothetical protein
MFTRRSMHSLHVVDVRDVARAHIEAAMSPAAHGRYLISSRQALPAQHIVQLVREHSPVAIAVAAGDAGGAVAPGSTRYAHLDCLLFAASVCQHDVLSIFITKWQCLVWSATFCVCYHLCGLIASMTTVKIPAGLSLPETTVRSSATPPVFEVDCTRTVADLGLPASLIPIECTIRDMLMALQRLTPHVFDQVTATTTTVCTTDGGARAPVGRAAL